MAITAPFRRPGRLDALALTAAIWFLAKFLRYAFPPLFESFQETYAVSNADLGMAFTAFMVVYALTQFPSGVLADRFGSVTVVTAGVLLASAAAVVAAVDVSFAVLVVAMAAMGAGTGAHKTVAVRLLSRVYPARTGRALGIFDTVGTFGGVAAPAAVVAVATVPALVEYGWRVIFVAAAVLGVGLAVAFVVRVPRRLPDGSADRTSSDRDRADPRRYLELFEEWRFVVFVCLTVLFAFAYNGTVAFLPLYLVEEVELDSSTANAIYGVLFLASVVQLVTGDVSDRIGTLPVIVGTLCAGTLGLVAFVILSGTGNAVVLVVAVALLGLGAHGFRPVRGAYLMATLPSSVAGGGLGIVRTTLMGAGAIAPAVVGLLSESIGFRPAFWVLAAAVAGSALLGIGLWVAGSPSLVSPE